MASGWQQLGQRSSFTNRISTLFGRHHASSQAADSLRATTTFEVPLFLSPGRYEPPQARQEHDEYEDTRSRSSTQSLIRAAASVTSRIRPLALSASSRYSSPAASPMLPPPAVLPFHEPSLLSSVQSTNTGSTGRETNKDPARRRRRKRSNALKVKVQAKKRLSVVFGITMFLTLITYIVLAATGTAAGTMFNVLLILLILSLAGVSAHSTIRYFVLRKQVHTQKTGRRRVHDDNYSSRAPAPLFFGETQQNGVEYQDLYPEKPIRIIMAEDEGESFTRRPDNRTAVQHPPPVYGNFRSSKRINPSLVHWQKVPPSPLTPTYDEAMSDAHRAVGYRPPSYVESEGGATRIVEKAKWDVELALRDIHPLERERIGQLTDNVI